MMTRDDMNEMVVDYLYDELPAGDRVSFEEALPSFPDISAEVRSGAALRQALRTIEPAQVPAGLSQKIMALAEQESTARAPESRSFISWLSGLIMQPAFATAMVFAVVGGTTFVLNEQGETLSEPSYEEARPVPPRTTAAKPTSPSATAPTLALAPPTRTDMARTRSAAPTAQRTTSAASGFRDEQNEPPRPRKKSRRSARTKTKAASPSAPKVAIELGDTREELYQGLGRKNLNNQVPMATETDTAKFGLSKKTQTEEDPSPVVVADKKPKAPKSERVRQSNKRLVAAFERALKKKQFSEARKLLGLIGKRPDLQKFYQAKRTLIPSKNRKFKGK
jgi:hypothetical protein